MRKKIVKSLRKLDGEQRKSVEVSRKDGVFDSVNTAVSNLKQRYIAYPMVSDVERDLLAHLSKNPGLSMTELSTMVGRDVQSTGNPIQRLKNKGYIALKSYNAKKREKELIVTEMAEEVLKIMETRAYECKKMIIVQE